MNCMYVCMYVWMYSAHVFKYMYVCFWISKACPSPLRSRSLCWIRAPWLCWWRTIRRSPTWRTSTPRWRTCTWRPPSIYLSARAATRCHHAITPQRQLGQVGNISTYRRLDCVLCIYVCMYTMILHRIFLIYDQFTYSSLNRYVNRRIHLCQQFLSVCMYVCMYVCNGNDNSRWNKISASNQLWTMRYEEWIWWEEDCVYTYLFVYVCVYIYVCMYGY